MGNRTPVSRVTGGDTLHYTTEDLIVNQNCHNWSCDKCGEFESRTTAVWLLTHPSNGGTETDDDNEWSKRKTALVKLQWRDEDLRKRCPSLIKMKKLSVEWKLTYFDRIHTAYFRCTFRNTCNNVTSFQSFFWKNYIIFYHISFNLKTI